MERIHLSLSMSQMIAARFPVYSALWDVRRLQGGCNIDLASRFFGSLTVDVMQVVPFSEAITIFWHIPNPKG